jgi:hypothetical protein
MSNFKKYTAEELVDLIGIGFCQPKFYKRAAWLRAKKVMDYFVTLNCGVIEHDFGWGKGKYSKSNQISNMELVRIYIKNN